MSHQSIAVEMIDHQHEVALPLEWRQALREAASQAWPMVTAHACAEHHLADIEVLDIAFVSRVDSDRIHREFMDVAGDTDVITFLHGELVICPAVAAAQAAEHGEPLLRELLRYIIHGMLHLAGHLDDQDNRRIAMERIQEELVGELWNREDFAVFSEENAKFREK
jgi:probable rRNA maturation factor